MGERARKYFNSVNQVTAILFYSFIYDLVRTGYAEANRKHAIRIKSGKVEDYFLDQVAGSPTPSLPPPPAPIAPRLPLSSLRLRESTKSCRRRWPSDQAVKVMCRCATCERRLNSPRPRDGHQQTLIHLRNSFSMISESANCKSALTPSGGDDVDRHLDHCPLPPMPRLLRAYEYISHTTVVLCWLKYVVLEVLTEELFGISKLYSCHIPGRTAILPDFCPSFSLIILSYHLVYRLYLCYIRRSFNIDCFLFVLHEERQVVELEAKYHELRWQRCIAVANKNQDGVRTADEQLRELFEANHMFMFRFRRVNKQFSYRLRCNRGLEHWRQLNKFLHTLSLVCVYNFAVWSVPLSILVFYTVLRPEGRRVLYNHCSELGKDSDPSEWSYREWRHWVWLIFDMIDSGWLLFETANSLVWPFSSMIFCAQYMNNSVETLSQSTQSITLRVIQLHTNAASNTPTGLTYKASTGVDDRTRDELLASIREDTLLLQCEIKDVLDQLRQVDQYISRLSAFCIFCWIFTNIYYQIHSLKLNSLLVPSAVVHFMQITAFAAFTCSYVYLSRTHSMGHRLYQKICSLVALDPDPRTKSSWLWVLEYFHKERPRYSFHLGPWAEMSLVNYIKSMSWLITGAIITIDMFKHKYLQ